MLRSVCLVIVLLFATVTHAQSIQFRIIERDNQPVVTNADPALNLAVQARVVGGQPLVFGLKSFTMDIRVKNEPEANGVLARSLISNPDGTYSSQSALNSIAGRGGIAFAYSYLARLNSAFNGLINISSGTFVHDPLEQDIGLITGFVGEQQFLNVPGIDIDGDGNPDTWSGNGTGQSVPWGATALLDPAVAGLYFGASGNWVDVYRFRYTVTNFSSRLLAFEIRVSNAFVSWNSRFISSWQLNEIRDLNIDSSVMHVLAIPVTTTLGACCDPSNGSCTTAEVTQCAGLFRLGACQPNTCPPRRSCCFPDGSCVLTYQELCTADWRGSVTCSNPCLQPGACCDGPVCYVGVVTSCRGAWRESVACVPGLCGPLGACCIAPRNCVQASAGACGLLGGTYKGEGVACDPPGDAANPVLCCPANVNRVNGITFQDVFDFLNFWFGSRPEADFDRDGEIEQEDVISFLNAWLAGC